MVSPGLIRRGANQARWPGKGKVIEVSLNTTCDDSARIDRSNCMFVALSLIALMGQAQTRTSFSYYVTEVTYRGAQL